MSDPPASPRTSPSATDATQAATEPVSGTERTIAASSEISGTEQTVVAPLSGASLPGTDASRGGHPLHAAAASAGGRTIGDELATASVERFGAVERDRFEPLGELARGGLGRVTRARDPRTGRIVAIKEVLRPTPEMLARFAREALVTSNLQHPAIVPVYEVGRWPGGQPFYAMKLVRGRAFDQVIAEASTTAARIALVPHLIAVADALAYAHSERVIHRDLKPANVLVGPYGETVVIDWGLARNLAEPEAPAALATATTAPPLGPGTTVDGAVIGTPAYMPPEQARGRALDERADVYAIGAILYHALAGVRPYAEAHSVAAILERVQAGPPRPLAELAPDVPAELVAIVTKAMAPRVDDRYPSAEGLAEDLRRFQAGQLVGAHPYTAWQLVRRFVGRHRAAVLTAVAAAAALAAFGVISVRRIAAERDIAAHQRTEAQDARRLAERRFAAGLEELGRQALLAGQPERALPLLAGAAATTGQVGPALDVMLGQARRAFAGLTAVAPAQLAVTVTADVTPDGRRIITSSGLGELRAWDPVTGALAWSAGGALYAALSPDGRWVLSAASDGAISARAAHDGAEVGRWHLLPADADPDHPVMVVWAPDSVRFAVGTHAGRVAVGARDAAALAIDASHQGELSALAFAPGGGALMSAGSDGRVLIRHPGSGAPIVRIADSKDGVEGAIWVGDDRIAAAGGDGARLWRVAPPAIERRFPHGPFIYGLAADPAAGWLVTYGHGEVARLWSLTTGELRAELPGHRLAVMDGVAVGAWLATLDETGGLYLWDPSSGEPAGALPGEGAIAGLTARGDRLIDRGEGRTRVWRFTPAALLRRFPGHVARVRDLRFDERGARLWSASSDGTARGVELATGAAVVLGEVTHREPIIRTASDPAAHGPPSPRGMRSLTLTPDGRSVLTASEDGAIGRWDAATGAAVATWRGHAGRVRRVAVSADGTTAFSIGDTTLRRWDVASGRELQRAELGEPPWDLSLFGDGATVAVLADDSRQVTLWDAASLAPRGRGPGPNRLRELVMAGDRVVAASADHLVLLDAAGQVGALAAHTSAFAADVDAAGATIAVGNARGEVVLHDAATAAALRRWPTGELMTTAVRFRPDGAILATAGPNRVHLWDPTTGRALAASPLMPAMITQLAWSPDGRQLAFGGGGGTIWVWDVSGGHGPDADALVACVSPWRLDDSALVSATFDAAACRAHLR